MATLGRRLGRLFKARQKPYTQQSGSRTSIPGNENLRSHKGLCTDVHGGFICSSETGNSKADPMHKLWSIHTTEPRSLMKQP